MGARPTDPATPGAVELDVQTSHEELGARLGAAGQQQTELVAAQGRHDVVGPNGLLSAS